MAFQSKDRGFSDAFVHILESIREKLIRLGCQQPRPYRPKGYRWDVSPESSLSDSRPDSDGVVEPPCRHESMVYPSIPYIHKERIHAGTYAQIAVPEPVAIGGENSTASSQFAGESRGSRSNQEADRRHELPAANNNSISDPRRVLIPLPNNITHLPRLQPNSSTDGRPNPGTNPAPAQRIASVPLPPHINARTPHALTKTLPPPPALLPELPRDTVIPSPQTRSAPRPGPPCLSPLRHISSTLAPTLDSKAPTKATAAKSKRLVSPSCSSVPTNPQQQHLPRISRKPVPRRYRKLQLPEIQRVSSLLSEKNLMAIGVLVMDGRKRDRQVSGVSAHPVLSGNEGVVDAAANDDVATDPTRPSGLAGMEPLPKIGTRYQAPIRAFKPPPSFSSL